MKKLVFLFALFLIATSIFTGCGSSANTTSTRTINVVTYAKWNPFEYMENGEIVGFDIDLLNAIANDAGFKVKLMDSGWDGVFQSLKNGNADMAISGITITDKRKETYDFSTPYYISRQGILVKNDSTIQTGKDLLEKKVAVEAGSTGETYIEKLMGKDNTNIKREKAEIIYQDVIVGSVSAGISDSTRMEKFLENNPDSGLRGLYDDTVFPPEYFGLMFPKNSDLKDKVNMSLEHLYQNGKYKEIYEKWFDKTPDIEQLKTLK